MILQKRFLTFLFAVIFTISPALAQKKTEYLNYTLSPDPKIEKMVRNALKDRTKEFMDEQGMPPAIQFATADLNGDGKPEIIARFFEEYYYRDEQKNTETHVFAYTKKGLIRILQVMAGDLAIGPKDETGLRQIIAFRGLTPRYDVYAWDGKRKYVKK